MKKIKEEFLNVFEVDGLTQGYLFNIKDEQTLKEVYDFYYEFYNPLLSKQKDYHDIVIATLNAGNSKRLGYKDASLVYFDDDFEAGFESMKAILNTYVIDLDGYPSEKKTIIKNIRRKFKGILYWIQIRCAQIKDKKVYGIYE